MRRFYLGITGIVFAAAIVGCGDSVPEGPAPTTATTNDQINGMKGQITKHMQSKDYAKNAPGDGAPETSKPAAESKTEPKPATAEPKPATAEPKPATAEPKPATKNG